MIVFSNYNRKSDALGSGKSLDTMPGTKAFEMIFEIRLTEEQLQNNGYPRGVGAAPGMAKFYTTSAATPNNENDRYCRRCGIVFSLDHFDEDVVDQCNYHFKSSGYRRGETFVFRALFSQIINVFLLCDRLF